VTEEEGPLVVASFGSDLLREGEEVAEDPTAFVVGGAEEESAGAAEGDEGVASSFEGKIPLHRGDDMSSEKRELKKEGGGKTHTNSFFGNFSISVLLSGPTSFFFSPTPNHRMPSCEAGKVSKSGSKGPEGGQKRHTRKKGRKKMTRMR
jgi:hypothetical protein